MNNASSLGVEVNIKHDHEDPSQRRAGDYSGEIQHVALPHITDSDSSEELVEYFKIAKVF